MTMESVLADLAEETTVLRELVADLDEAGWATMTPSEPWTISDQVGHLAYFDEQAALAVVDPAEFSAGVNRDAEVLAGDVARLHRRRRLDGADTLAWWISARHQLFEAFAGVDPEVRVPWYGPPMRARSAIVARLMETWAHGIDVADALGSALPVTDRLFDIADLGVRTFSWSYRLRGLEVPDDRVRVALRGISGTMKIWNNESSASITGPVEEFCLVVAQRRNVADTHLVLEGGLARQWMEIAQVFAGPPGRGR
jgi:uncharacterized protein (TIGR03084 family)